MKKWMNLFLFAGILSSCEKEENQCKSPEERAFDISGFTKVEAGGHFKVFVKKGNQFSVVARGCSNLLDDLRLQVRNMGTLYIEYKAEQDSRAITEVELTLPHLNSVVLTGAAQASVEGFSGQPSLIRHVLSGLAACTVEGTGINAQVELSGTSHLKISGDTESLYGNISGEASLHGYETRAREVDISTSGKAQAWVHPTEIIYAEASGDSRVYYRGNAPNVHTSSSGRGKVIRE